MAFEREPSRWISRSLLITWAGAQVMTTTTLWRRGDKRTALAGRYHDDGRIATSSRPLQHQPFLCTCELDAHRVLVADTSGM